GEHGAKPFGRVYIQTSDEHVMRVVYQTAGNLYDLLRCLPFPEDHLRKSRAQRSVLIDLGETEIFKRQRLKLLERCVETERASTDVAEHLAEPVRVHL